MRKLNPYEVFVYSCSFVFMPFGCLYLIRIGELWAMPIWILTMPLWYVPALFVLSNSLVFIMTKIYERKNRTSGSVPGNVNDEKAGGKDEQSKPNNAGV
jgi:hypothetical protein